MPKNITKIAVCNSGVGIFSFLANFNFFHHNLCFQNAIFRSGVFARGIMGGGGVKLLPFTYSHPCLLLLL